MTARPWPPPIHKVETPYLTPRRTISFISFMVMIQPVAPIGWPKEIRCIDIGNVKTETQLTDTGQYLCSKSPLSSIKPIQKGAHRFFRRLFLLREWGRFHNAGSTGNCRLDGNWVSNPTFHFAPSLRLPPPASVIPAAFPAVGAAIFKGRAFADS